MIRIPYEGIRAYEEAVDRVVQAAMDLVDTWDWSNGNDYVAVTDLERAVDTLRSLYADRGLRESGPPGKQDPHT